MRPLITLTTDFTLSVAVGTCKGVIKRICPEAEILDLSHAVPPFDVETGAFWLQDALPYLPPAIHVAVVDPGVGSTRRPVAVRAARGDILIAPDNGLLSLALRALGGATAAYQIDNPAVMLSPLSETFHGRDIFAPAAAHLAAGLPLEQVGTALDPATLAQLDIPAARMEGDLVSGLLLRFDPFGSARTNITASLLQPLGLHPWHRLRIHLGDQTLTLPFVRTFSDVPVGEPCCLIDSSGRFCIAVNQGSARETLGLRPRTPIRLSRGDVTA